MPTGKESHVEEMCRDFVHGMKDRSDLELALFCRSQMPTDVCREMRESLGERPWSTARISSTCHLWETRWQARLLVLDSEPGTATDAFKESEYLDDAAAHKMRLTNAITHSYHNMARGPPCSHLDDVLTEKRTMMNATGKNVLNRTMMNATGENDYLDGSLCDKNEADVLDANKSLGELITELPSPSSETPLSPSVAKNATEALLFDPVTDFPPALPIDLAEHGQEVSDDNVSETVGLFQQLGGAARPSGSAGRFLAAASLATAGFAALVAVWIGRCRMLRDKASRRTRTHLFTASDAEGQSLMHGDRSEEEEEAPAGKRVAQLLGGME